jgi:hypothetical protein
MNTKLKAVEKSEEKPEELPEFSEELPPIQIDPIRRQTRLRILTRSCQPSDMPRMGPRGHKSDMAKWQRRGEERGTRAA